MKNLIKALIAARAKFQPIPKSKVNPYYKSKYADLDAVLAAVEPALQQHSLTVIQTTDLVDGQPVLVTQLWHESGEYLEGHYYLPKNDDPQKLGAAVTYARRYALCALLSVTADEDTDGQTVSSPAKLCAPNSEATSGRPSTRMHSGACGRCLPHKQLAKAVKKQSANGQISRQEWLARQEAKTKKLIEGKSHV